MRHRCWVVVVALSLLTAAVSAQDPVPPAESLEKAFPKREHYSPYAGRNFPVQVFWGDTHLHTGMSMDAGAFGARLLPEDAYRFARGEELVTSTGMRARLSRPLDFLVVADHSDNMGFFPDLFAGKEHILSDPTGRNWYDRIKAGDEDSKGVERNIWITNRPQEAGRNLSFVNITDISSDSAFEVWDHATVVFTLQAPAKPGNYPLAAVYFYGTEKSTLLGYKTNAMGMKKVRGGYGGGSGRVRFTAVSQIQVQ